MTDSKQTALLDKATTDKILDTEVYTSTGEKVKLGTQFDPDKKTILVFIRHFFCGNCQQYVVQLASVRPEVLQEAGAKIIIVGCGEWNPISSYIDLTGFQGPILADPTRTLYKTLGMIENLAGAPSGEETKSYMTRGILSNILCSIWEGPLKHPDHIGKQGNMSQLGGEFIFGADKESLFAYRMKHTADHTETAALMQIAGVEYP